MQNTEDRKWLYGHLKDNGYEIGTQEEFESSLDNSDDDAKWYHQKASDLGLEVGSYDDFVATFRKSQSDLNTAQEANLADISVAPEPSKANDLVQATKDNNKKFGINAGIPSIADVTKAKIEGRNIIPAYSMENRPQVLTGFGEGVKQGTEQLGAGLEYAVGEAIAPVVGTSYDDKAALEEIERLQAEGKDVLEGTKNITSLSSVAPATARALEFLGAKQGIKAAEKKAEVNRTIQQAIKDAGGDIDAAKSLLAERAGKVTKADTIRQHAEATMAKAKPTKGWAWVGSMVPQMAAPVIGMGLTAVTKMPIFAQTLGRLNMGALTASTAGQAMAEARQAGATNADVWSAGIINGAIEYFTEEIPFNHYTQRLANAAKNSATSAIKKMASDVGSPANKELQDLLAKANKQLDGKLLSGKNVSDYLADITAESISEGAAEGLQTISSIIYENPEDYPTLTEIINNSIEGLKGGLFMGSILGGASKTAEHRMNRNRRKQQGFVDVAEITLPNNKSAIIEIVTDENGNEVGYVDDVKIPITDNNVIRREQFSFDDFERGQFQLEQDEAYENGRTLETAEEMNDANNMLDITANEVRRIFGASEDSDVDAMLGDNPLQYALSEYDKDPEIGQTIIDYLNAKATVDGVIGAAQDRIELEARKAGALIDSRKSESDGMVHPAKMKLDDRGVYIISGNVKLLDDGSIDTNNSDESIIIMDAATGEKSFATAKDLLSLDDAIDPEEEKAIVRENIAETIATEVENKMLGVFPMNVGDTFPVLADDGSQHTVQIASNDGSGIVEVIMDNEAQTTSANKEIIQQMANAYNRNRAEQFAQGYKEQIQSENISQAPDTKVEESSAVIPLDKQGRPDFNAMEPDMFINEYVSRYGEDNAIKIARKNIEAARANIKKIDKKIDDVLDPNQMQSLFEQKSAAEAQLNRYNDILGRMGASEDANETEDEQHSRLKKESGNRIYNLFPDGFPNVESVILADIATGNRIRWSDKTTNGAVTSRGLAAELGLSDSNAERTRRLALISNSAPTPEEYAESLQERLNELGVRYDESSLRDVVLDVYSSVDTRSGAWEALEEIAAGSQQEDIDTDWEDMQKLVAYEKAQKQEEREQELPDISMMEDATPITEGEYAEIEAQAQAEEQADYDAMMEENNKQPMYQKLSEQEVDTIMHIMENNAEIAKDIEFTPENWEKEFGDDGVVLTPVGNVKMGENQYLKLLRKKREKYFGLIKTTLTNPDIVLEEYAPSENAERDTVLLFVKTFRKSDGSRYIHFESVTVKKEDREVSISSHEVNPSDLKKKMHNDNVVHLNDSFFDSEGRLIEPQTEGPDLVPTPNVSSESKDTTSEPQMQEVGQKNAEEETEVNTNPTEAAANASAKDLSATSKKLLIEPTKATPTVVIAPSLVSMEVPMNLYKYVSKDKYGQLTGVYFDKDRYLVATDAQNLIALKVRDVQRSDVGKFVTKDLKVVAEGEFNWRDIVIPASMKVDGVVDFVDIANKVGKKAKKGEKPKAVKITYGDNMILFPAERLQALVDFQKAFGVGELRFDPNKVVGAAKLQINSGSNIAIVMGLRPAVAEYWDIYDFEVGKDSSTSEDKSTPSIKEVDSKVEIPDVIRGAKWDSTGEPTKMRFKRKGDNFDGYITVGKKKYGRTTSEGEEFNILLEDYGSLESAWNAYEQGEVFISPNLASIIKTILIEKGDSTNQPKANADEQVLFRNVYHGSGSEFDKFDHSYMGTGEGNQAFGWGTYVTEVEGIGKQYARMTSKPRLSFKGDFVNTEGFYNPWRIVSDLFNDHHGKLRDMRAAAERYSSLVEEDNPKLKALWEDVKQVLSIVRSGDLKTSPARYLYSVEIPDNDGTNYLEYGKSLSKVQLNNIKRALYNHLAASTYKGAEQELKQELDEVFAIEQDGKDIYGTIGSYLGSDKATSEFLNKNGFVGVSYPADGGNAGDARNYVIFNEADLDITDSVRFRQAKNIALETVSVQGEHPQTVISSADGTKILKNIDSAIDEYKNDVQTKEKTFLGRVAKAIGAQKQGSGSQYATFEAKNGKVFTIRLADHNARVSTFDAHDEKDGISIIISARENSGINNDGTAHIVEYFYDAIKLRKADGKPLVEILKSIKQTLYSGEYKDTTGLAERGEVNIPEEILFRGAEPAPVFYSNAEYAVKAVKQEKATPEQWLKMIEKNGGLKAGEDKWLGLSDWLKASDKKTLTKQEVLDFIKENQIQIEEVEYAENPQGFEELKKEYDGWLRDGGYDYAWDKLIERYGYDSTVAFDDVGGELVVQYGNTASKLLGGEVSTINSTRLDYTTNGLDNKREIALTVPTIESWNESDKIHFGDAGNGRAIAWVRFGEAETYTDETIAAKKAVDDYLAEMRDKYDTKAGEETDAMSAAEIKHLQELTAKELDSRNRMSRVLVIDEIQSKRHQEGREKGYIPAYEERVAIAQDNLQKAEQEFENKRLLHSSINDNLLSKYGISFGDASYGEINELRNAYENMQLAREGVDVAKDKLRRILRGERDMGIPTAPFEKNWAELAMKRMLRYAAENGFDKIAWTTGEQQADRYDLSKSVDVINAEHNEDGSYNINVATVDDSHFIQEKNIPESRLTELVGKDMALSIVKATQESEDGKAEIEGDNLRIGGSGMKAFYDQMLPSFMNKYGKKWGVKVQDVSLPYLEKSSSVMHSIDVTDAMRESVMQGQPMFRLSDNELSRVEGLYDDIKTKYNVPGKIVVMPSREEFEQMLLDNGVPQEKLYDYDLAAYIPDSDTFLINGDGIKDTVQAEQILFHEVLHKLTREVVTLSGLKWLAKNIPSSRLNALSNALWPNGYDSAEAAIDELISIIGENYIIAEKIVDGTPLSALEAYLNNHITLNEATELAKGIMTDAAKEYSDIWDKVFFETKRLLLHYKNAYYEQQRESRGEQVRGVRETMAKGSSREVSPISQTMLGGQAQMAVGAVGEEAATRRAEQRQRAIVAEATDLASSLGVKLNVIEDVADITDSNTNLQRAKRGAKAWYDVATDQVYFVAPNATSIADAQESVLHEVVAHKGLRDVVGRENFNKFLDKVFYNAAPEIRAQIVGLAAKNGWNFRVATEEYLASLAERGFNDRAERTFWQKVRDLFMDMLREAKIAIGYNINDNDMRYMLWRTYQMQKSQGAMALAEDVVMQQKMGVGNFRARFIGEKGASNLDKAEEATIRLDNLAIAREMEAADKSAKTIKMATGWERGADGKWRYEVNDAKLTDDWERKANRITGVRLADVVTDKELFNAYPELSDVYLSRETINESGIRGYYQPSTKRIVISDKVLVGAENILNHEIQHAIQEIEGFTGGFNPNYLIGLNVPTELEDVAYYGDPNVAYDLYRIREYAEQLTTEGKYKYLRNAIKSIAKIYLTNGWFNSKMYSFLEVDNNTPAKDIVDYVANVVEDGTLEQWKALSYAMRNAKDDAKDKYQRAAGEVEARNVARRMGMSEKERRASLALETEDVAREDQILIEGYLRSASTRQMTEEEQIVADAKADGTYLKAPNGKDTNLTPEQWVTVRTNAFKKWFGNWEKAARIEKLRNSNNISISGNEIAITDDFKQNKSNAIEYGKILTGNYVNNDTGKEVRLTSSKKNGGLYEILEHNYKDVEHIQSIAAIPQIIEESIYVDTIANEDRSKRPNVLSYDYYVCGLNIGGEEYTVKAVVSNMADGSRYYDHKLTNIEKGRLIDIINKAPESSVSISTQTPESSAISDIKDKRLISLLQTNSSKIVDANGEPKVVWHGGGFAIDDFTPKEDMHFGTKNAALERILDQEVGYDDVEVTQNEDGSYSWKYRDPYEENGDIASEQTFETETDAYENAVSVLAKGVVVKPYFLNIRNIAPMDDAGSDWANTIQEAKDGGYDGILYENWYEDKGSDSYIAFNPNQIKSATDNVGSFDANNDDIRFRSDKPESPAQGTARAQYDYAVRKHIKDRNDVGRVENLWHHFMEHYQDSMRSVKSLYKAILDETGNKLHDYEDVYKAENHLSSKNKAQIEAWERDYMKPLQKEILSLIEDGADYNMIQDYLLAKHGIERNRVLAQRDAEQIADSWEQKRLAGAQRAFRYEEKRINGSYGGNMAALKKALDTGAISQEHYNTQVEKIGKQRDKDLAMIERKYNRLVEKIKQDKPDMYDRAWDKLRDKDYSGLTELTGDKNTFNQSAQDMVDAFEAANDTKKLWEVINAATKATLRKSYDSGMMNKETYEKTANMFKYYIPLRGWENNAAADYYEYLSSPNMKILPALKTAKGRTSRADDPIATIGSMGESSIIQGNRNLMKQKLLNFAQNNPTSLLTVSEQWYVRQPDGTWMEHNPIIPENATGDEVDAIVKKHEADMIALGENATKGRSKLNLGMHATTWEGQEHVVRVKRNGKEYQIFVNGNPIAAQAINGFTNPNTIEGWIKRVGQAIKNFMARAFTSQNPTFIGLNLGRDVAWAGTTVAIKEDAAYAAQYTKNIAEAFGKAQLPRLISKWQKGTLDINIPIERYFKEFIENGGETGFTQLNTVDDYKRNMERFIKEAQSGPANYAKKSWRWVWDGIEFLNRSAEDTTRFMVYLTSRQMGRSITDSISNAKDITVNFNKKGRGGYGATFMNFAYIFFNATIQSLANFGSLLKNHPKKTVTALTTFASVGLIAPMLSLAIQSMLSGDDEEPTYWDLPEWVRRNNIVIYMPFIEGGHLTIPLPHELRPFYGMGELAFSVLMGKESVEDALKKSIEGFASLLPFDYTGNGGNVVVNFTPTIAQPFAQLIVNKDYFGTPIYRKTAFNEKDPEWTKAYKSTNRTLVDATELVNKLTGGNAVKSGMIDINPAIVEHLFESYLGGMGKTINRTAKTLSMLWDEDAREWRNVPVLSSFYTISDERTSGSQLNREYFDAVSEAEDVEHLLSGYKKQAKLGAVEYAELLKDLMESDIYKRYEKVKGYKDAISELNTALKEIDDPLMNDSLETQIMNLKVDMLEELNSLENK